MTVRLRNWNVQAPDCIYVWEVAWKGVDSMASELSFGGGSREWWSCDRGGCATWTVLVLLLVWYCSRLIGKKSATGTRFQQTVSDDNQQTSTSGISETISETDLRNLVEELEERSNNEENWKIVIERRNDHVSYIAKCCDPKDGGPTKYLSTTTFENCTTELLRDFYMDNEFRKEWDKTVVEHEQLQIDQKSGTEIGRTIKKFPLLTPREYVLAWRVWEGNEKSYYCFIKACEHPLAVRQNKYKRVEIYLSGWRIRKVPDRNACEIKMLHQEDAGLNREMAKLAFAKGIWSYVCKMQENLQKYRQRLKRQDGRQPNAVTLLQKVPAGIEDTSPERRNLMEALTVGPNTKSKKEAHGKAISLSYSYKWLANGLLLLGGAVCLKRGHSSLGTKLVVACLVNKLVKKHSISRKSLQK